MVPIAPFDFASFATWARVLVAAVWLVFGLVFKLLRALPRHERIVARILGARVAPVLTRCIGVGEVLVGLWMMSGIGLQWCALFQTALILTMNGIELRLARDLLLSPRAMIMANLCLLALAWYAALGQR
jgi:hypothetical protein